MAITLGTKTTLESGVRSNQYASCATSATRAVTWYRRSAAVDDAYIVACDLSGTDLTVVSGPTIFDNTGPGTTPWPGGIAPLTSDTVLISYDTVDSGNAGSCVVADVSAATATFGTVVDISAGNNTDNVKCATLTATLGVAVFIDATDGSKLKATAMTVSGTTITPGSVTTLNSNTCDSITSVARLSDTHAIVFGVEQSDSDPFVYVISISGTTITSGSQASITGQTANFTSSEGHPQIVGLSSSLAVAVWPDGSDPQKTKAVAISVSGTTATPGTAVSLTSPAAGVFDTSQSIAKLSATKAAIAWSRQDSNTGIDDGRVSSITVDGTTITDNADDTVFDPDVDFRGVSIAVFDGTQNVYIAYLCDNPSYSSEARVATFPASGARFYQGAGVLTERFTLPFDGVAPNAMTLNADLGTVVFGSDAAAAIPIVSSVSPYTTGTASGDGLPTTSAFTAVDWI